MEQMSIKDQIAEALKELTPEQQAQVLAFTRRLHSPLPPAIPGEVLLARAREINFDPQDLKEISDAIEEGCERIDWDGWE